MDESYEFLAVWRYVVRAGREADFELAYGPEGEWAQLFRKAEGYVRTELMKSGENVREYMTIDYWKSADAFEAFQAAHGERYEELDHRMAELTERERLVGYFLKEGSGE